MKNENTNATTIILYYLCEYCRWNSLIEHNNELYFDDNSLIVDLNKEINMLNDNKNNNIDNDKFDNIVKEGMNILREKLNQQIILSKNNNGNDIFHSLIESWTLKVRVKKGNSTTLSYISFTFVFIFRIKGIDNSNNKETNIINDNINIIKTTILKTFLVI